MGLYWLWPLVGVLALTCCVSLAVWRRGLLPLLHVPGIVLQRPLFAILRDGVRATKRKLLGIVRLAMLIFLDLEEEDQNALREGLSPQLRDKLFGQPVGELLPGWARRILLGPDAGRHEATPRIKSQPVLEKLQTEKVEKRAKEPELPAAPEVETLFAAWTLGVYAKVVQLACRGASYRAKIFWASHGTKVTRLLSSPALVSNAMVSLGCGSVGCIAGGCVGGLCGLPMAIFTFGLSIPFGALLGSSVGGCGGLAAGALVAACKDVITNAPKPRLTPR